MLRLMLHAYRDPRFEIWIYCLTPPTARVDVWHLLVHADLREGGCLDYELEAPTGAALALSFLDHMKVIT